MINLVVYTNDFSTMRTANLFVIVALSNKGPGCLDSEHILFANYIFMN